MPQYRHRRSTEATHKAVAEDLRRRGKFDEERKMYEDAPTGAAARDLAPAQPASGSIQQAIENQQELKRALEAEEERKRKEREEREKSR